jgi:predicted ATP-grasp superfamily ATP-dependent carboligase
MSAAPATNPRAFIVIGTSRPLLLQVLLSIHAFTDARCLVICKTGTRFLRKSPLCADYIETGFSGNDDAALVERINRFSTQPAEAILIPADCAGARLVDRIRPALAVSLFPTADAATIDRFDDKWRFHEFCAAHGLRTPPSRLVADKHALNYDDMVATLGSPFLVKPVNEDSSRGAHVITSRDQFSRAVLDDASYRYAPLIVQRYIAGTDVGVNLLALHGEVTAISIQQRVDPARDGSRIVFFDNPYLEHVARTVAKASGYHGVMNIDARIEAGTGDVYLFESNPRFWRSTSASVWCGMNFVELGVMAHAGKVRKLVSGSADTYFHPLYAPALCPHALFGNGQRRKMARMMLFDACIFLSSTRIVVLQAAKPSWTKLRAWRRKLQRSGAMHA